MQERQGDQREMARGRRLEPQDLICSGDYPRKQRVQGGLPGGLKTRGQDRKRVRMKEKGGWLDQPSPGLGNEGQEGRANDGEAEGNERRWERRWEFPNVERRGVCV